MSKVKLLWNQYLLTLYIWQLSWHQTCSQKPCNVSHDNKNMDSYINFEVIRSKFKAQFCSTLRQRKLATLWSISSKSLFVPSKPCKKVLTFLLLPHGGIYFSCFLQQANYINSSILFTTWWSPCVIWMTEMLVKELIWITIHCTAFSSCIRKSKIDFAS